MHVEQAIFAHVLLPVGLSEDMPSYDRDNHSRIRRQRRKIMVINLKGVAQTECNHPELRVHELVDEIICGITSHRECSVSRASQNLASAPCRLPKPQTQIHCSRLHGEGSNATTCFGANYSILCLHPIYPFELSTTCQLLALELKWQLGPLACWPIH